MPLSLPKLEKLLVMKGFVANKFFIIDKLCVYIHVISVKNSEDFLLYIPSKYKFVIEEHGKNIHKIKFLDIENYDNTVDEYAGLPDPDEVEKEYEEIDIELSPNKKNNIEGHLESGYKRTISLKDISKEDTKDLKDIYRQLKRLGFCVQAVRYKIAIFYKNYLCSIRRDDSIECFSIKNWPNTAKRKIYVIVDLELLYENMDSLQTNIETVRKGIYKVLDKNQLTHTRMLQRFLDEKNDIMISSEKAYNKKEEYTTYLIEFEQLLSVINVSEEKINFKIHEINEKYSTIGIKGLHTDIEKSHQINKLETELNKISIIKQDITNNIDELIIKREDTLLTIDKIMFNTQIMLYEIIKNFRQLSAITS